jgi:hypothetical protein
MVTAPTSGLESATLVEPAEFAVAAAREEGSVHEIAEGALAGMKQSRNLVTAEGANERGDDRLEPLDPHARHD